jgi:hypothetical protein
MLLPVARCVTRAPAPDARASASAGAPSRLRRYFSPFGRDATTSEEVVV